MSRRFVLILAFLLVFSCFGVSTASADTSDINRSEGPEQCIDPIEHITTVDSVDEANYRVEFTPRPNGTVVANYTRVDRWSHSTVRLTLPRGYTVVSASGFEIDNSGDRYSLDSNGETNDPTVVYQARNDAYLNSSDKFRTIKPYHDGSTEFVTSILPNHGGGPFLVEFPEGGYLGNTIMRVGPIQRVETINNGCHSINIVIPEGVDHEAVNRSIEQITTVTKEFDGGGYNEDVTLFVHPDHPNGFASAVGEDVVYGDQWTKTARGLSIPVHEYIHTRQHMEVSEEMRWYIEASATYHTARSLYESDTLTVAEYDYTVAEFTRNPGTGDLKNISTWPNQKFDYNHGGIYLSVLDAKLRNETNGNSTMLDVFRSLNNHREIDSDLFAQTLRQHGLDRTQAEIEANLSNTAGLSPAYQQGQPHVYPRATFFLQQSTGISFAIADWIVFGLSLFSGLVILVSLVELSAGAYQEIKHDSHE